MADRLHKHLEELNGLREETHGGNVVEAKLVKPHK
jgi:hypothetical protein